MCNFIKQNISNSRPDVCLSIGNVELNTLQQLLKTVPFAEIRIDLMCIPFTHLFSVFGAHKNLIATYRHNNNDLEQVKYVYFNSIEKGARYIDLDVNLPEKLRKEIIQQARHNKTGIILSYHNFIETQNSKELNKIISGIKQQNPDIVKVACMANTKSDCAAILSLYESHQNIIAFCMGKVGSFTRILAPLIGAPFTYTSIEGAETAEGQINYNEIVELLNRTKTLENE